MKSFTGLSETVGSALVGQPGCEALPGPPPSPLAPTPATDGRCIKLTRSRYFRARTDEGLVINMEGENPTAKQEVDQPIEAAPLSGEAVENEIGELTRGLAGKDAEDTPRPREPEPGPSFWRSWPVAIVALLISGALTVLNIAGLGPYKRGPAQPSTTEIEQTHELELLALVGYIEDYREQRGRLPSNLADLEVDLAGVETEYRVIDEADFVVSVIKGPVTKTFDSRIEPADDAHEG